MRFTHTADLPECPDVVMARLLAGPTEHSQWDLSADRRRVRVHTERHLTTRSPRLISVDTEVAMAPVSAGTRLTMTVAISTGSFAEVLFRPWAARRVSATFAHLVHSLQTGAPLLTDLHRRGAATLVVRARIATLAILLLIAALFVAFFALISWLLAAAVAAAFILAAVAPVRRIAAARRAIGQLPSPAAAPRQDQP